MDTRHVLRSTVKSGRSGTRVSDISSSRELQDCNESVKVTLRSIVRQSGTRVSDISSSRELQDCNESVKVKLRSIVRQSGTRVSDISSSRELQDCNESVSFDMLNEIIILEVRFCTQYSSLAVRWILKNTFFSSKIIYFHTNFEEHIHLKIKHIMFDVRIKEQEMTNQENKHL